MDWVTLRPFVFVLVGVILRTFVPVIVKALKAVARGESPEPWDWRYVWAPLAVIVLDVLAFGLTAVTESGWIESIAQLDWRPAILVGIGGQDALRELLKAFERE